MAANTTVTFTVTVPASRRFLTVSFSAQQAAGGSDNCVNGATLDVAERYGSTAALIGNGKPLGASYQVPLPPGIQVDQYGTGYLDVNNSDNQGNYHYTGFGVDIALYLSRQLFGQDPVFLPVSSATRAMYLADGAVRFFAATYTIDQPRQKRFDLAGPYLVTAQGVMAGPHSPPIRSLLDLNGKTVCVVGHGSESKAILRKYVSVGLLLQVRPRRLRGRRERLPGGGQAHRSADHRQLLQELSAIKETARQHAGC